MITGLAVSWALHAVMAVAMSPAAMPETVGAASMGAMPAMSMAGAGGSDMTTIPAEMRVTFALII